MNYRESSGLGSHRLQKAIERNRRKQIQKQAVFANRSSAGALDRSPGEARAFGRLPGGALATKLRRTEAIPALSPVAGHRVGMTVGPLPGRGFGTAHVALKAEPGKMTWYQKLLVYGGWVFCCILLGRLIFADRGVVDYYARQGVIQQKIYQNHLVVKENSELQGEIKLLTQNPAYRKKLVRQHLGVIAQEEYLILFARDKAFP